MIIVNLHIPKNAGTTLDIIFKNIYGRGFYRFKDIAPGFISNEEVVRGVLSQQKYSFFSGHSLCLYENLD